MVRMCLKPSEIFFSQDSINNCFDKNSCHAYQRVGETLDALCERRCQISDIPIISVMKKDGKWFTADNRRLWVFRQAERLGKIAEIPVNTCFYIPSQKFTTYNDGQSICVRRNAGGVWHLKPDYGKPSSRVPLMIPWSINTPAHCPRVVGESSIDQCQRIPLESSSDIIDDVTSHVNNGYSGSTSDDDSSDCTDHIGNGQVAFGAYDSLEASGNNKAEDVGGPSDSLYGYCDNPGISNTYAADAVDGNTDTELVEIKGSNQDNDETRGNCDHGEAAVKQTPDGMEERTGASCQVAIDLQGVRNTVDSGQTHRDTVLNMGGQMLTEYGRSVSDNQKESFCKSILCQNECCCWCLWGLSIVTVISIITTVVYHVV